MTTFTGGLLTSASFAHTADATTFRTWSQFVSGALTTIGASLTADPQPDLSIQSRPGTNTYVTQFRAMSDAAQGSNPISFSIGYGTSTTTAAASLRIAAGASTTGSGTLVDYGGYTVSVSGAGSFLATNTQVYACHAPGVLWLACISSSTGAAMGFAIARSQDQTTGAPTQNWSVISFGNSAWTTCAPTIASIERAAQNARTAADAWPLVYPSIGSGINSGRIIGPTIASYPGLEVSDAMVVTRASEFNPYTTFTAAPLGVERTYMALPLAATNKYLALVWE